MSTAVVPAALVELFIFALAVLLGARLQDLVHEQERRRWLARNRKLQNQVQELSTMHTSAVESEDQARWQAKGQAGLIVLKCDGTRVD